MSPTHITHPDNDTSHWSPARAAAYALQQRIDELTKQIAEAENWAHYYGAKAPFAESEWRFKADQLQDELNRVSALPPLEYAAELAASLDKLAAAIDADTERWQGDPQADADSLAAFVARFADQDADYRDWYATRESDRPI